MFRGRGRRGTGSLAPLSGRLLLLLFLLSVPRLAALGQSERLVIVSWNVENLFHPSVATGNEWARRFSPSGEARWTHSRFDDKLANLALVIGRLKPDILCLQEVESRQVLEKLQVRLARDHGWRLPYILHQHGGDFRGMDVAIMSRYEPSSVDWVLPFPGRRDILAASFEPGGVPLKVVNNHWKSRFVPDEVPPDEGRENNRRLRNKEAAALRRLADQVLLSDPRTALVVAGDFNDDFDDLSLVETAGILTCREAVFRPRAETALYNLAAELPPRDRGTFYYRWGRTWNSFDIMAVSPGMLPEAGPEVAAPWQVRPAGYHVVRSSFLADKQGRPLAFRRIRRRRDGRVVYQHGYSDHFPVKLVLVRR